MHHLLQAKQADIDTICRHYAEQVRQEAILPAVWSPPAPINSSANLGGNLGTFLPLLIPGWVAILTKFMGSLWAVLKDAGTPDEVKAAATEAALRFYDETISPLVAQALGRPLVFATIVNPALRGLIPQLVNGLVAGLFSIAAGPVAPATPAQPADPSQPAQPQTPSGFIPY